jgi:putative DNA primase/helicase
MRGGGMPDDAIRMVGLEPDEHSLTDITDITDIPKELPPPPAFPVDAMPRRCRTLIRETSTAIGCPPEFVALPMLVLLGTAIGNSRVLKLKAGWEEGSTIYAAVIAEPGEKKTPATKVAIEPAIKTQAALREDHRRATDEYKTEMRQWEVDKRENARNGLPAPPPPEEPRMERTVVEDITVEALAVVLEGTPRGVLAYRDELSGWVRAMDQYRAGGKGADRQFYLSAWSNSYAAVDRKSRTQPLIMRRPFVGVYGAIQPGVLHEIGDDREDGLLDRFALAYPDPVLSQWTDDEISDEARDGYAQLYQDLRGLYMPVDEYGDPAPVRVYFSPSAKELLKRAVNELRREMYSPGFPGRLKGPWSKLEAYMARLCLILAMARAADEETGERVEDSDVLAAVVLVDYFRKMVRRVYIGLYGESSLDKLAGDLEKFMQERGGEWEGQPAELLAQLESQHKPKRANELTKYLKAIASRTPTLEFDSGERWVKDIQNKRRFIRLVYRNVGNVGNVGKGGAS